MKVAVILTARPSWSKLEPVCRALKARPDVELQIIACASALLERYGKVVDVVKAQGYDVAAEVWSTYEGANLLTSAKETGALCSELASTLPRLRSDVAVICADRHEVLAAAQAAAYLHISLVHLQGGERTGSIDDKCRDSITQLADVHCVSTRRAQMRVYALTGNPEAVVWTGCPSIDLAKQALPDPPVTSTEIQGTGPAIDPLRPFLIVLQHPVTSEAEQAFDQMTTTLDACAQIPLPRLLFLPGEDAGADAMTKAIRAFKHQHPSVSLTTVKNLPPARFLKLLTQCAVLVGNSSAGIRESSWLGVPVVNIGSRQQGRERGPNVISCEHDAGAIVASVQAQLAHGKYKSSTLYGTGDAGEKIANVIMAQAVREETPWAV